MQGGVRSGPGRGAVNPSPSRYAEGSCSETWRSLFVMALEGSDYVPGGCLPSACEWTLSLPGA